MLYAFSVNYMVLDPVNTADVFLWYWKRGVSLVEHI